MAGLPLPLSLRGHGGCSIEIVVMHKFISLSMLSLGSGLSFGAVFYPIVGVTSDTAGTDFFPASRLIEGPGVGFELAEPHNRTSTLTWVTNAPNGGFGDYFAPTPQVAPRLVFDLGSSVALN
jgi:hypothetical protein